MSNPVPAVAYMEPAGDGGWQLRGSRCTRCGAVHLGRRSVCPACTARGGLEPLRLAERGRVYTFTTVHRSVPGVAVPFVMAVVDLDDGPALRGTLVDAAAGEVRFGMPVRVVFRDSGQRDAKGNPCVAFFFTPDRS